MKIKFLVFFSFVILKLSSQTNVVSQIDTLKTDSITIISQCFTHLEDEIFMYDYKLVKSYYSNGSIKEKYNLINGAVNGLYMSFYQNGKTKELYSVKKDVKSGLYILYYPNGKLKIIGYYQDLTDKSEIEVKSDTTIIFNPITLENELLITKEKIGIRVSNWKYFNEDGSLFKEIEH